MEKTERYEVVIEDSKGERRVPFKFLDNAWHFALMAKGHEIQVNDLEKGITIHTLGAQ